MKHFYLTAFVLSLATAVAIAQPGSSQSGAALNSAPAMISASAQESSQPSPSTSSSNPANTAQDQGLSDEALRSAVHQRLAADPALANIKISAQQGVVKLQGTVVAKSERNHAEEMAETVQGVKRVENLLKVEPNSQAVSATASKSSATGEKSEQSEANETGESAAQSTAGAATPQTRNQNAPGASTSVNAQSSASGAGATNNTAGSIVGNAGHAIPPQQRPNGSAPSPGQQAAIPPIPPSAKTGTAVGASSIKAANTQGEGNANALPQSDIENPTEDTVSLQNQIQTALKNEPTLSNDTMNVTVNDSAIELNGTTETGKQKQTANRIALSYANNRHVVNHITVNGRNNQTAPVEVSPEGANPRVNPGSGAMEGSKGNTGNNPRTNPQQHEDETTQPH